MSITRRDLLSSGAAAASSLTLAGNLPQDTVELPGKTRKTRFAVNVEMWWRGLPFLERIKAAAKMGFPAIEFWPFDNKDIDAVADLALDLGLEIAQFTAWGFSPGMNETSNHDAFVKRIETASQIAKRLRCKMATVVGGNDVKGLTQEEMHTNIITGLKLAAPIAEANDLTLILEPMNIRVDHKGHCLYGSVDAVRICREVDSTHVKLNWDLYHMQISEGDLCGRLRDGFDQVGYLQLADHPGRNEPGTGEINYSRVLKQAHDLGYRGFVGLECRPRETPERAAQRIYAADIW